MNARTQKAAVEAIKKAIVKTGLETSTRRLHESVWTADEDRARGFGWAGDCDDALAVICHERGLLMNGVETRWIEAWMAVEEAANVILNARRKVKLCIAIEAINGAISVVYNS